MGDVLEVAEGRPHAQDPGPSGHQYPFEAGLLAAVDVQDHAPAAEGSLDGLTVGLRDR